MRETRFANGAALLPLPSVLIILIRQHRSPELVLALDIIRRSGYSDEGRDDDQFYWFASGIHVFSLSHEPCGTSTRQYGFDVRCRLPTNPDVRESADT